MEYSYGGNNSPKTDYSEPLCSTRWSQLTSLWEKFYRKLQGRTSNLKHFLWREFLTFESEHASLISLKEVK